MKSLGETDHSTKPDEQNNKNYLKKRLNFEGEWTNKFEKTKKMKRKKPNGKIL